MECWRWAALTTFTGNKFQMDGIFLYIFAARLFVEITPQSVTRRLRRLRF